MESFDKYIEKIANEEMRKLNSLGIRTGKIESISINNRLKAKLGQCILSRGGVYKIQIAGFMEKADEKTIRETVMHELLHTCKGCMNHGPRWKQYSEIVNRTYGYNLSRVYKGEDLPQPEKREPKYVIECQQCGNKSYRTRRCKVVDKPQYYRCGKCGGKLKVQKL